MPPRPNKRRKTEKGRIRDLAKAEPYDLIYADPPWKYQTPRKNEGQYKQWTGQALKHYNTMSHKDMLQLKIPAKKDAVLLCWATFPKLTQALECIEAWGFRYVTAMIVWVKMQVGDKTKAAIGTGQYTRSNAEVLLLGVRGTVMPLKSNQSMKAPGSVNQILFRPRSEHSEKPHDLYSIIDTVFGNAKRRLEMFARNNQEGWDSWGDQVGIANKYAAEADLAELAHQMQTHA